MLSTFRADWSSPVGLSNSWVTEILTVQSNREHRRGNVDRPLRIMRAGVKSMKGSDAAEQQSEMRAAAMGRTEALLYTDFAKLSAGVADSATVLPVYTTADRRFAPGVGVAITFPQPGQNFHRWKVVRATVQSVGPASITLTSPVGVPILAGARVYPVMVCDAQLQGAIDVQTSLLTTATLEAREAAGPTAIPALAAAGVNPSDIPVYEGFPVLNIPQNWRDCSVGVMRPGQMALTGLVNVPVVWGSRALWQQSLAFTLPSRVMAFRMLRLFDSRRGRLYPFWLTSPTEDFVVTSSAGSVLTISATIPASQVLQRTHVALKLVDGTYVYRRVVTAVDLLGGAGTQITCDGAVPPLYNILSGRWHYWGRLDSDTLEESWRTDEFMECKLPFTELIGAPGTGDPTIPEINPVDGGGVLEPWTAVEPFCPGSGVEVPMFEVPCQSCDPDKLPKEGNPLALPALIKVRFKPGCFIKNTHWTRAFATYQSTTPPTNAQPSANFTDLIAALQGDWNLAYDAGYTVTRTRSRHFHHARLDASSWLSPTDVDAAANYSGGVPVTRRVWRKVVNYTQQFGWQRQRTDEGGTYYTSEVTPLTRSLEVRLVAETPDSPTQGSLGTLLHIYVFTDQVQPSFVDGGNYTLNEYPVNPSPPSYPVVKMWRDDPVVTMASGDQAPRNYHPHLALCAFVPTTWQSRCLDCANAGKPVYNSAGLSASESNTAFGPASPRDMAAMTLGGGCAHSVLLNYVCVDSGPTGISGDPTPLPYSPNTYSGYTPLTTRTPLGGFDDPYLSRGNAGSKLSMRTAIEVIACAPATPAGDCCTDSVQCVKVVGCTPSSGPLPDVSTCCFSIDSVVRLTLNNRCFCNRKCKDGADVIVSQSYSECGDASRQILLPFVSCPSAGVVRWEYSEDDPSYTPVNFSENFDSLPPGPLSDWTGGSNVSGQISDTTTGATNPVYLNYTILTWTDMKVRVVNKRAASPFGISLRGVYAAVVRPDGYVSVFFNTTRIFQSNAPSIWGGPRVGDVLEAEIVGERIRVWLNGVLVATVECLSRFGTVPASGEAGVAYVKPDISGSVTSTMDDFSVLDLGSTKITAWVQYSNLGFEFSVPSYFFPYNGGPLPYYSGGPCSDDPVPAGEGCWTERERFPSISNPSTVTGKYRNGDCETAGDVGQAGGPRPTGITPGGSRFPDFEAIVLELLNNEPCGDSPDLCGQGDNKVSVWISPNKVYP